MIGYKFKKDSCREECMTVIEQRRRQTLYPHSADMCTLECKNRGTSNMLAMFYPPCYTLNFSRVYYRMWIPVGY